ncbi:hypothetical protein D3C85_1378500 [compost metagenome]
MLGQQAHQWVATVQFTKVDGLGHGDAFISQALAPGFGQVLRQEACGLLAASFQRRAQTHAGALQEALHVGLGAQGLLLFVPLGQHLVGFDAALGEHGAVGLGFFQGVLPLRLQWL